MRRGNTEAAGDQWHWRCHGATGELRIELSSDLFAEVSELVPVGFVDMLKAIVLGAESIMFEGYGQGEDAFGGGVDTHHTIVGTADTSKVKAPHFLGF